MQSSAKKRYERKIKEQSKAMDKAREIKGKSMKRKGNQRKII